MELTTIIATKPNGEKRTGAVTPRSLFQASQTKYGWDYQITNSTHDVVTSKSDLHTVDVLTALAKFLEQA